MERLEIFLGYHMADIIAVSFGVGTILGLVAILGGYAITKAMSLVSDK